MKDKSVVVFGAGRFGSALAEELFKNGVEVMVLDSSHDRIQNISSKVTTAIIVDVLDSAAIEELGLKNFDVAVIAIGSNLEASIVATVAAKEHGIPMIYAKASSEMQSRILKKVGADQIIYPERELGERLARSISGKNILEYIHFSKEYGIAEYVAPKSWVGQSLASLDVRNKHDVSIIAIKRGEETIVTPKSNEIIKEKDSLMIIAEEKTIEKLDGNV